MSSLRADACPRSLTVHVAFSKHQKGSLTRQHALDEVERNILAVKHLVHQLPHARHELILRVIVLQERDVRKSHARENHAVRGSAVAADTVCGGAGHTVAAVAARKGSCETVHARASPLLEDVLNIIWRLVVPVVVREEDALGSVSGVGEELLVQAVLFGSTVTDEDAVLGHVIGWWFNVYFIPYDDDFVE